ncbi:MAG: hypothetical protein FD181_3725 [Prolixibacteraceae bacterium]|nr:MAG: hypothetical protein FD181_3725 [Prolixibacteraceae bacterium]
MKNLSFLIFIGLLAISTQSFSQLNINSSGELTFYGDAYPGGLKIGPKLYDTNFTIPTLYPAAANWGGLGSANNYFHGAYIHTIYTANYGTWPSDKRAKENIRGIGDALGTIKLLNPVKYDIKDSFYENLSEEARKEFMKTSKNKLGFIAQEVQEILPEIILEEHTTGTLGICTMELIPVLVQAIKEQQLQIEELKKQIQK